MSEDSVEGGLGCGCITVVFIVGVLVGANRFPDFLRAVASFLEP